MKREACWLGVILALLVPTTAAEAHWRYTRYGMSPAEVIAASGGKLRRGSGAPGPTDGTTNGAVGRFEADGYSYAANFYFRKGRLEEVRLDLDGEENCLRLHEDFQRIYGQPVDFRESIVRHWAWSDRKWGNRVKLMSLGRYCQIQYIALPAASARTAP